MTINPDVDGDGLRARRQADQALVASDGAQLHGLHPSGFDPSRKPIVPVLSALRQPPVVGRTYLVPCAEYTFLNRRVVWPVIGTRHEDTKYIVFSQVHYHIDPRFLSGEQARYLRRHGRNNSVKETAAVYVLSRHGDPIVPLATLRPRRCRIKSWAYTPPTRPKWLSDFDRVFGKVAEPIRTSDGRLLCPHKKTDLSQFAPDENGIVTCPLHGLRVRCAAIAIEAGTAATVKQGAVRSTKARAEGIAQP